MVETNDGMCRMRGRSRNWSTCRMRKAGKKELQCTSKAYSHSTRCLTRKEEGAEEARVAALDPNKLEPLDMKRFEMSQFIVATTTDNKTKSTTTTYTTIFGICPGDRNAKHHATTAITNSRTSSTTNPGSSLAH